MLLLFWIADDLANRSTPTNSFAAMLSRSDRERRRKLGALAAARTAMIASTTSSSNSVAPLRDRLIPQSSFWQKSKGGTGLTPVP
jgi:hypothetical protein